MKVAAGVYKDNVMGVSGTLGARPRENLTQLESSLRQAQWRRVVELLLTAQAQRQREQTGPRSCAYPELIS